MEAELEDREKTLQAYRDAEKAILSGERPYAYTIGPRNKTQYPLNLQQLRAAIKELFDEVQTLEGMKTGCLMPRTRAVIPRDV